MRRMELTIPFAKKIEMNHEVQDDTRRNPYLCAVSQLAGFRRGPMDIRRILLGHLEGLLHGRTVHNVSPSLMRLARKANRALDPPPTGLRTRDICLWARS